MAMKGYHIYGKIWATTSPVEWQLQLVYVVDLSETINDDTGVCLPAIVT